MTLYRAVQPNYFTCTLGQAVDRKLVHSANSFSTILDLVDAKAKLVPHLPALGFADFLPQAVPRERYFLSYLELRETSQRVANRLFRLLAVPNSRSNVSRTVGLLCTSSIQFAITWLALMRLGFSVMLLAPHLNANAIKHLCAAVGADVILVDERCRSSFEGQLCALQLIDITAHDSYDPPTYNPNTSFTTPDIAFYFHTSGTSAGLPKPIPQAHSIVCALPSFSEADQPATFTTTPLYHGGLADCLRAWTSDAMIWFFPEGSSPITANTLMQAIRFAQNESSPTIRYLSCVPYILQILSETNDGTSLLRSMDLVGFGGAALAQSLGDSLVQQGVNLLSRYGSAECGFLLSSHRNYSTDKEWRYLRSIENTDLLSFEPREDGLYEVVVSPKWPFRSQTNRDDGSFATSDLFEPHPSIPNAWRYHSRADAQITLANGKKFDPSPIEAAILASSNLLQDALVFGSGRHYPGIMLFPKPTELSKQEIATLVWPHAENVNKDNPSHSRLTRSMFVVIFPKEGEVPLERNSKGSVLRRQGEQRYAGYIEAAYGEGESDEPSADISDEELPEKVMECFVRVLEREVEPDKDVYSQGVDSLACIQIRRLLEKTCTVEGSRPLPLNIVYDQGTVNGLVNYLRAKRNHNQTAEFGLIESEMQAMRHLARRYSDFDTVRWNQKLVRPGATVVLTGASGFLGAHIVHLLQQNPEVERVICLLRATTSFAAHDRVNKSLHKRNLSRLEAFDPKTIRIAKVVVLPANLSSPDLGLSSDDLQWVTHDASIVIHAAWIVNFALRLSSFEDQIAGTRNLVQLAASAGARFLFVSSTASVISALTVPVPERVSTEPGDASSMGYAQSKWVAEQVCLAAQSRCTGDHNSSPLSILRVGQLCSNSGGIWNTTESYPSILSTANITGCLPELPNVVLDWLPVEVAAQAIVEAAMTSPLGAQENASTSVESGTVIPVYHILNPNRSPSWSQMLSWLREVDQDTTVGECVPASEWLTRLHEALKIHENHPSEAHLPVWQRMVLQQSEEDIQSTRNTALFSVDRSQHDLPAMREVSPLEKDRLIKTWNWIQRTNVC